MYSIFAQASSSSIEQSRILVEFPLATISSQRDSGIIPTSENLVQAFYHQLKKPVESDASNGSVLYSVKLFETERNSAVYCPYKTT